MLTRDVEIGSPVSSILNLGANATLVMTLGDIERVFVRGKVDEADIGRVRLGQPARITTETFRDRVFEGRVTQISPIGVEKDNVTTFEVEVSIDNSGKELKANMTANAEIILEEFPNSLLLPEAAVIYDDAAERVRRRRRRRRDAPAAAACRSRSASATARASRSLSGLKAGDKVVFPARRRGPAGTVMKEVFIQVFQNLRANKLRSFLTMFGILWGVISVVDAVGHRRRLPARQPARARGAGQEHRHRLGRPHVAAGRRRARRPPILLTIDDARALRARVAHDRGRQPRDPARRRPVKSAYNAAALTVHGIEPQYQEIRTIDIERGRMFRFTDEDGARRVAIIGADAATQLFGTRDSIGQRV